MDTKDPTPKQPEVVKPPTPPAKPTVDVAAKARQRIKDLDKSISEAPTIAVRQELELIKREIQSLLV